MDTLQRVSRRAARRILFQRFVHRLGWSLVAASTIALLAVGLDRALGPWWAWWLPFAVAGGIALAAAIVLAVVRLPGDVAAIAEVDRALGLKDRLGSALSLGRTRGDDPFVVLATRDAEALAPKIRVSRAIPIRWDAAWWWWPLATGVAVLVALLVPPLGLLQDTAQAAPINMLEDRARAQEAIEEAMLELPTGSDNPAEEIADLAPNDDRLDKIQEELSQGLLDPDEGRAQAAAVLDELAQELDDSAELASREDAALREAMSALDAGGAAPDESVEELREALRTVDPSLALQALENLEARLQEMSEEERAAIADQLEQMAEQMDAIADETQREAESQQDQTQQDLADRGLEDAAEQLASETSPDQLEETLKEAGANEEAARELAEQLAERNTETQAKEQAAQDARETSDALREAAGECENPQPSDEPGQQQSQDQSQGQQPNPGQQQGPQDGQQQGAQQQNGQQQNDQQNQQQGQQNQQAQDGQQPDSPSENPDQNAGQNPGQGQESQNQQGQPGQPQDGSPQQGGEQQGDPQQGQQQSGQQGQPAGGQSSNPAQGQGRPAQPGSQPSSSGSQPGQGQPNMQRLRDSVERMGQRQADAQQLQQQADDLRGRSDSLLRSVGGDPNGQTDPDAARAEAPDTSFGDTDTMDLTRGAQNGRVVGNMTSDQGAARRDPGAVSNREVRAELEQALKGAEQAIEERTTPARYRNIERYFRRALERAENEAPASDAPATPEPAERPAPDDG